MVLEKTGSVKTVAAQARILLFLLILLTVDKNVSLSGIAAIDKKCPSCDIPRLHHHLHGRRRRVEHRLPSPIR